jgi:hypothetical protein
MKYAIDPLLRGSSPPSLGADRRPVSGRSDDDVRNARTAPIILKLPYSLPLASAHVSALRPAARAEAHCWALARTIRGRCKLSSRSDSPRPATTSACSCGGSLNSCVPSSGPSPKLSRFKRSLKSVIVRVLHGGLLTPPDLDAAGSSLQSRMQRTNEARRVIIARRAGRKILWPGRSISDMSQLFDVLRRPGCNLLEVPYAETVEPCLVLLADAYQFQIIGSAAPIRGA